MRKLIESSALYKGVPVVFAMDASQEKEMPIILASLISTANPDELKGLTVSSFEQTTQKDHIYFYLQFTGAREPGPDFWNRANEQATIRGKHCLNATTIALLIDCEFENDTRWSCSAAGARLEGLTSKSAKNALNIINKKIEETKTLDKPAEIVSKSISSSVQNNNNAPSIVLSNARNVLMPAPNLIEYTASFNRFPVVIAMRNGQGKELQKIVESLSLTKGLEGACLSNSNESTQKDHIYFFMDFLSPTRAPLDGFWEQAEKHAENRGKHTLKAMTIGISDNRKESENNWVFSVCGTQFEGLTPTSVKIALDLIERTIGEVAPGYKPTSNEENANAPRSVAGSTSCQIL